MINTGKYSGHFLPNGTYHFEEFEAAYQYSLSDEKISVDGTWRKDGREVFTAKTGKTTNNRQTVTIDLQKIDKETGKPVPQNEYVTLEGAEFDLVVVSTDTRVIETGKAIKAGTTVGHYVTDENGKITVSEMNAAGYEGKLLPNGVYNFIETKAPTGYVLDQTPVLVDASYVQNEAHIDVDSTCSEQIIRQKVAVQKHTDEKGNGEVVLENIGFKFYLVSDVLKANNLKDDSYLPWEENTIKQKGYYGLDAAKFSELIKNVDPVVIGANGEKELFTDKYGELMTADLAYGDYIIYESTSSEFFGSSPAIFIQVPWVKDGNGNYIHDIDYTPEAFYYQDVLNWRGEAYLHVTKVDAETGEALAEKVQFEIYDESGKKVTQSTGALIWKKTYGNPWETADGFFETVEALPTEVYTLKELASPTGYVKGGDITLTITMTNATATQHGKELPVETVVDEDEWWLYINIPNAPIQVEVSKKDIATSEELPGATLQVFDSEGNLYEEWVSTDEPHLLRCIPVGEYTLKETIAPAGYVKAEEIKFTVRETAEIQKVEMKDDFTKVEISKTDLVTGEPVEGAHLQLLKEDGSIFREWDTTEKAAFFDRVPVGNYTLVEIYAPAGFVRSESVPVVVLETGEIQKFEMKDDFTKVEISKKDLATKEELEGAKLQILDADGNVYDEWISSDEPYYLEYMPVGRYTLVETSAPEGYLVSESVEFEVLETGEIQTVEMLDDFTKVKISKKDITTKDELPGATLQLINDKEAVVDEWVSTEEAHLIERLPAGHYFLVETSSPAGFLVSERIEFDVLETGDVQAVEMLDDYIKVEISKKDITTGEELPGATIQIIDADGKVYEEWVSTDKPHVIERIPAGEYTLKETIAPAGFVRSEDVPFTITETGVIQKAVMVDDYTKIEITKSDLTTGEPVIGAHLQLIDSDEKVIAEWDTEAEPFYMEKLPVGEYTLKETFVENGYVIADSVPVIILETGEVQKFDMTDDYTKVKITKTNIVTGEELPGAMLQILNEDGSIYAEWTSSDRPQYFEYMPVGHYTLIEVTAPEGYAVAESIEFDVLDTGDIQVVEMKDEHIKVQISKKDITTKEELPGAKLQILDADGNVYEEWTSTEEPHLIDKMPAGKYTLVETSAPDGYLVSESIEFEVTATGELQTIDMLDDYTKVQISKKDITSKEELEGARLQILDKDGNVYEEWTSAKEAHMIERIPAGKYTLVEITAPNGYRVAEKIEFEVKETGEVQSIEMFDEKIPTTPDEPSSPEVILGVESNKSLWYGLLAAGTVGLAGMGVAVAKKKKEDAE